MRGFNQAAYLAERLSDLTGIPWNEHLVKKIRSTRSQKKLNAIQRRQNLKNAYRVTEKITGFWMMYTQQEVQQMPWQCVFLRPAQRKFIF